jgi:hypothetical protein
VSKTKKNQRDCPAAGKVISSADCGSGRGSQYSCPADCPHFPFTPANYDLHVQIEERLIDKSFELAARIMSAEEKQRLMRELSRIEGTPNEELINHARFVWTHHIRRDGEGKTNGERWLEDRLGGLSNDEKGLLRGFNQTRPVLLEVQRILDHQTFEAVDLLDGSLLRILDRANASELPRYSVLFGWCYPMPHYERSSGSAMFLPEVNSMEPVEVLREIIRHLGGPEETAAARLWLAEHFVEVVEAILAVTSARREQMLASIDSRFTKTDFRLLGGADLAKKLLKRPEVEEEPVREEAREEGFERTFIWFQAEPKSMPEQPELAFSAKPLLARGKELLGRVFLGPSRVRIEAISKTKHGELRARFEKLAGTDVEFVAERIDDLGGQLAAKSEPFDADLVPPRLLEDQREVVVASHRMEASVGGKKLTATELIRAQYENFADEPIPMLEGRTPRSAASDPELRPRLIRLMKGHIRQCDTHRRERGADVDLNPLLADLGLEELISEPPPLGNDLEDESGFDGGDLEWEKDYLAEIPPVELDARVQELLKLHPTVDTAVDWADETFPALLDIAYDVVADFLESESDWNLLETLIVRVCWMIAPGATEPRELNFRSLEECFHREIEQVTGVKKIVGFESWMRSTPQRAVLRDAIQLVAHSNEKSHGQVVNESTVPILSFIKALIMELTAKD